LTASISLIWMICTKTRALSHLANRTLAIKLIQISLMDTLGRIQQILHQLMLLGLFFQNGLCTRISMSQIVKRKFRFLTELKIIKRVSLKLSKIRLRRTEKILISK
jgi:hypothetical protein